MRPSQMNCYDFEIASRVLAQHLMAWGAK